MHVLVPSGFGRIVAGTFKSPRVPAIVDDNAQETHLIFVRQKTWLIGYLWRSYYGVRSDAEPWIALSFLVGRIGASRDALTRELVDWSGDANRVRDEYGELFVTLPWPRPENAVSVRLPDD